MKTLRNISLLGLLFISIVAFAKNQTISFKVDGFCEDCKEKIETALDVPGISYAEWNIESKMLTVRYNDKKITEDKIHTIIADTGYSTDQKKANPTAQEKLDKCCQPKKGGDSCCSGKKSSCAKSDSK